MKTIDTTTRNIDNNNAQTKTKTVMVEHEQRLFRIVLKSDSYDFQSGGRVEVIGNDNKWETIKSFNLVEDFGVQHSYQYFRESNFDKPIAELKKFIKKTAKYLTPIEA